MKKIFYLLIMVISIFSSCTVTSQVTSSYEQASSDYDDEYTPQSDEVSYQDFYDDLRPYGQWINYQGYGQVWVPSAGADFKPYETNGHWVYTDYGWTWASDYSWGWAAFHYGRWKFDNAYGWFWVPGYEWAPAWVSWRSNDEYYGWAPMEPGIDFGISVGVYNPPVNYWCFVSHNDINREQVRNYCISENRNVTIVHNTTVINNYYSGRDNHGTGFNRGGGTRNRFATGPDPRDVSRFTNSNVRPIPVRASATPGAEIHNGSFRVYRPAAYRQNNNGAAQGRQMNSGVVVNQPVNGRPPVQPGNINQNPVQRPFFPNRPVQTNPVVNNPVVNRPVVNQPKTEQQAPPPQDRPFTRIIPGRGNFTQAPVIPANSRIQQMPAAARENRIIQPARPPVPVTNGNAYPQINNHPQMMPQPAPQVNRPVMQNRPVMSAPVRENVRNRGGRGF